MDVPDLVLHFGLYDWFQDSMSSADTAPLQTVPARPGSTPGDPGPATGTPDLSPQPHAVLARGHTPDIHQGEPHSISAEDCTSSLSQCPLFTMHVDILYTNCLHKFHLLFHNEHGCHYCAYLSPGHKSNTGMGSLRPVFSSDFWGYHRVTAVTSRLFG